MTYPFVSDQTRDEILRFLRNPTAREHEYRENRGYACLLFKIGYDTETDFLYLLRAYNEENPRQTGANAEYAGIYSRPFDKVFDGEFAFSKAIGQTPSASAILKDITTAVKEAVMRLVDGKPVSVTEEAEPVRDDRDYFLEHGANAEALKCFYDRGTMPEFDPHIHIDRLSTPGFVKAINHCAEAVEEFALKHIRKNAAAINDRLWQLDIVRERLKALEAAPGEHHIRRHIAGCIDTETMKMVGIGIEKEGKSLSCKITASTLGCANDTDYCTWHLDASGRRAFEEAFGRSARLLASDIARITYGRKTLYQKNES